MNHFLLRSRSLFSVPTLLGCALLASAIVLFAPTTARASGPTIAAEAGPVVVLNEEDEDFSRVGFAFAGRAGYTFSIPFLAITPEAKLGFQSPGAPNSFTAMGGARVNFFEGLSPAVFSHAGFLVGDMDGFVWDVGLGLDVTAIPVIDIGIFGAYYNVGDANFSSGRVSYQSGPWHWLQFGAQCAVHF